MPAQPAVIGVSLKMYLGHAETLAWCEAVAAIARTHPATTRGEAELVVLPSYLSVPAAVGILDGVAAVGAQDLAADDAGASTGEVSGGQIRELGATFVEVGHAERRRLFGETDEVVRRKADRALASGLVPLLCVGEEDRRAPADAARECIRQLDDALALAAGRGHGGRIVVAYEPQWAIGAAEPASDAHIRAVGRELRAHVRSHSAHPGSAVVYGGSAGPGLLTRIGDDVDGLFLGRFAHDPRAVAAILDEVHARAAAGPAAGASR
ncbi:triose-phosphate isomerase family protein [Clavibacter sepedonicus]|uniref:triose-phosphate isomerase family protein n=1 Tax=Clavibacter TaxID=1573 RepID=UPI00030836BA|nr:MULTISPECIES: triose-phosphate isomerase family protein [Clavibacter]MBD5380939.1 triosephosphate isomerase [Clavibacter sp.]OQJ48049.1 triose-phosphate isomerase [Clavibacter sepedonicus]OQJ53603.1 triose-phosphate isomerase [Clavibacter sepedonicus]UUK66285.1 triose-phosphate isomerase [Clavibacter sepedonicus]